MKKRLLLFAAMLIMGSSVPIICLAQGTTSWSNQPITIFGDPDISRTYVGTVQLYKPQNYDAHWVLRVTLNLTVSNPSSIQFSVNGNTVQASYDGGNTNAWHISYPFQPGISYAVSVTVSYSQYVGSSTCGTWSGSWDDLTGM